ncbi:MAG: hypothetical protein ACI4O7_10760 [Aristaeellaceae bacterium]
MYRRTAPFVRLVCLLAAIVLTLCGAPRAARAQETRVVSVFINHPWFPVQDFTGIIPEEITRVTGVTLEITVAQDMQHLSRLIAQDRLPDIVYTSTMLERMNNPALCYSYDELLERYDIDWDIPAQLRANALTYSPDGRIYGLLNNYASNEDWQHTTAVPMTASLMIRQDILDAMGITQIRTVDELKDVYLRVKEEYPHLVPLTFDKTHRFNFFRCCFGLGLLPFQEQEDGSWIYYARDERYLAMLAWLNELYRAGCMIPDSFAATDGNASRLYKTDRSFSFSACTQNTNLYLHNDLIQLDESYCSVELYPLDGACYDTQGLGWSASFITRNARDPETCMELLRWMYSDEGQHLTEWGREGVDYVLDENGLPVFSDGVMESIASDSYNQTYNPWFYFGTSAIVEAEGRCALQENQLSADAYDEIRRRYRILPWVTAALAQMPEDCRLIYDRISSSIDDYEAKIILSADEAAFQRNLNEMLVYLDALQMDVLEAHLSQSIPEQYAQYQQRMKEMDLP